MTYLVKKYSFPPERDMMMPPTLVDPLSTSWYKDPMRKKSSADFKKVLSGTDVISAKIRDSMSPKSRLNSKDLIEKYTYYSNNTANSESNKYGIPSLTTSPGKIDLYGVTDKKLPSSTSVLNSDIRNLPSRANDVLSSSNTSFPVGTYTSTYNSAFRNYTSNNSTTLSKDIKPLETKSVLESSLSKSTNTPKLISSYENSPYSTANFITNEYIPGYPSTQVPKASLQGTDEFYMRKLADILNVHTGPMFTSSPSMVTDYMFIGGYKDADNWQYLRRLGITHVLNMAAMRRTTFNPYPPQSGIVGYEAFDADDHEGYNIMQHFTRAKAFIDKARWAGGKVLVHCAMGVNRSGAMCCAYLIAEHKMTLLEAARKMKRSRGTVLCNRGFQKQLLRFARQKGCL